MQRNVADLPSSSRVCHDLCREKAKVCPRLFVPSAVILRARPFPPARARCKLAPDSPSSVGHAISILHSVTWQTSHPRPGSATIYVAKWRKCTRVIGGCNFSRCEGCRPFTRLFWFFVEKCVQKTGTQARRMCFFFFIRVLFLKTDRWSYLAKKVAYD